jgi:2-polyprenyl-6-methoxyphenol hydroxylase-like FAD-dependent oxidoreductase
MAAGRYDLITVGGGLAASALARAMVGRGARVLVLEREERFRDRVRGEFISSWGVAEARELGLLELLCQNCAHQVPWADLGPGPRNVVATTPQGLPGISFFHPEMQETLLAGAAGAGAEVRRGVAVEGIEPGAHPAVLCSSNGRRERVEARLVVAADGRNSAARRWMGFTSQRNVQPFLFAGVRLGDVEARNDLGHFIFNPEVGAVAALIPQRNGMFRGYLGHPTTSPYRLQGEDNLPRFFQESIKAAPQFGPFYARARATGPLASFEGGDSWVEHPYRKGVALLGDAAATSDPSFGQGMGLSLRGARVLRDVLSEDSDWDRAGDHYADLHHAAFQNLHRVTVWFRNIFQEQGPEADERRRRAMPRILEDFTRVPDHLFSGPDLPADDTVRARFFGEV